jgi:transcriptional regulator with XRE-family HTH domain
VINPHRQPPAPWPRAARFDPEALYVALDRRRRERHLTRREVCRQLGENTPSVLTRLGQGRHPSADLLIRMLLWLGDTDVSHFLIKAADESEGGPPTPASEPKVSRAIGLRFVDRRPGTSR